MGSAGSRGRKRAHHLPKVEGPADMRAFGPSQSPYLVEGRIEATGQLARGLKNASSSQLRSLGLLFAVCVGFLALVAIVMSIIGHFVG